MAERWYLHYGISEQGPFGTRAVIEQLESAVIDDETPIRREGDVK
jgi:hypothetical protein